MRKINHIVKSFFWLSLLYLVVLIHLVLSDYKDKFQVDKKNQIEVCEKKF